MACLWHVSLAVTWPVRVVRRSAAVLAGTWWTGQAMASGMQAHMASLLQVVLYAAVPAPIAGRDAMEMEALACAVAMAAGHTCRRLCAATAAWMGTRWTRQAVAAGMQASLLHVALLAAASAPTTGRKAMGVEALACAVARAVGHAGRRLGAALAAATGRWQ